MNLSQFDASAEIDPVIASSVIDDMLVMLVCVSETRSLILCWFHLLLVLLLLRIFCASGRRFPIKCSLKGKTTHGW